MTTQVFGHKAPDTDSTGSPLIWAWYLSQERGEPAEAVLLGEPAAEPAFVLERWGIEAPRVISDVEPGQRVVLVDTNNPAELPAGLAQAEVVQIIDHHRLTGGIETKGPIDVTIRPLACTVTVMAEIMGEAVDRMPEGLRGMMLSCILSDTLEFRSPPTTPTDRALAERLAGGLGVSIPDLAAEMFAAKSDVSDASAEELLRADSKETSVGGLRLRVTVLETTAPGPVLERKAELLDAMPGVAEADGVDEVLFFLVDILKEEATLLVPNERVRAIAERSFGADVEGDTVRLPGVMSRKKQIIPVLAV
jgi:manganese-dependent inorganic pyrophosphatase